MTVRAAALILLALAPPTGAGSVHPHVREGVWAGLGLGAGSARVTLASGAVSDNLGGTAFDVGLGVALGPAWLLGARATAWYRRLETQTTFLGSSLLVGTWFPRGGGWFGELGAGVGHVRFETGGVDREAGLALHAGAGYEWRLTPGFAFAPRMEIARIAPGGTVDAARTFSLRVSGTWY